VQERFDGAQLLHEVQGLQHNSWGPDSTKLEYGGQVYHVGGKGLAKLKEKMSPGRVKREGLAERARSIEVRERQSPVDEACTSKAKPVLDRGALVLAKGFPDSPLPSERERMT